MKGNGSLCVVVRTWELSETGKDASITATRTRADDADTLKPELRALYDSN